MIVENRFNDRVALVTGAGSGLGRAVALQITGEGGAVLGIDIDEQGLALTADKVNAGGGQIETRGADVTDRGACDASVSAAVSGFGHVDVLVNCAAILRFARFTEITTDEWNQVIGVNLNGTFNMCQATIDRLLEVDGSIVNVASVAGVLGQAYAAAYSVSKAGVIHLTRSIAMEYARTRLRVNAVAPGTIATPMVAAADITEDMDTQLILRQSGFRGLAEPSEIADIVVFLASDAAKWIHGAVVNCDGGITAG